LCLGPAPTLCEEGSTLTEIIGLNIAATGLEVRQSLILLARLLAALNLSPEDIGKAEIVLAEVLNNIVEHAYQGIANGRIDVNIICKKASLTCRIKDTGAPVPDGVYGATDLPRLDCNRRDLPEGGFGRAMIRMLSTSTNVQRRDGENCLTLTIPLDQPFNLALMVPMDTRPDGDGFRDEGAAVSCRPFTPFFKSSRRVETSHA